jgi:hypothetical protein
MRLAGSGVSKIADEHAKYPWMMGYLPSFVGEGAMDGRRIAKVAPHAKIAVLYENSDFGKDLLNGLRAGLGGKAKIVATQSYETTDNDVASAFSYSSIISLPYALEKLLPELSKAAA